VTLDSSGGGPVTFSGNLTATGAGTKTLTLTGTNTGLNTIGGVIPDNSGTNTTAVTKSGPGTWVLSAAITYSGGTTVNQGTLQVTNTLGTGTGTGLVTVNGAGGPGIPGTLGGTGSVAGGVIVNAGGQANGIIAPGVAGVGTLNVASGLSLAGEYVADVTTSPADAADRIAVTGNVTLTGSTLTLPGTNTYAPLAANVTYTLMTFTGTRTGAFASVSGLPAGYQLVYAANAVQIAPVPEPVHILLACAAVAGWVGWRRRKSD